MLTNKLTGAGAPEKTYIEDVFSTYLYTGTGSAQTITNGIDLAGKGGMVWIKSRSNATDNYLIDTENGRFSGLISNSTSTPNGDGLGGGNFLSSGFSVTQNLASINVNTNTYASWTFRKAPKFFDVVTYTGTGVARTVNHSLGSVPGMVIVKCTSTTCNWAVYHNSQTSASYYTKLNLTNAQASDTTVWNGTAPTASVFSVGTSALTNTNGATYVAYLFAHDTTTDGLIQCGSYTGTGTTAYKYVELGWEPQYVLVKASSAAGNWIVADTMRGLTNVSSYSGSALYPNLTNAEATTLYAGINITSTGFGVASAQNSSGVTYIYMAIRRGPMRTPTDGTKVFIPDTRADFTPPASISTGFPVDLVFTKGRGGSGTYVADRLRGGNAISNATVATAEGTSSNLRYFDSNTSYIENFTGYGTSWNFRRAPGFFDVVCYNISGTTDVTHNLGVKPELIIIKRRDAAQGWIVFSDKLTANRALQLEDSGASFGYISISETSTKFTPNSYGTIVGNCVAYLFASCPGVSKVGSYTGNGSSQTINCGFTNGARFFLVKATSTTGNWWVYDSARGIVSSTDPVLALNSTAAEVTSTDAVDPDSTGIIVNQEATCSINANGVSYIYLAIA